MLDYPVFGYLWFMAFGWYLVFSSSYSIHLIFNNRSRMQNAKSHFQIKTEIEFFVILSCNFTLFLVQVHAWLRWFNILIQSNELAFRHSVSIVWTPADYGWESSIENVRIVAVAIAIAFGWIASFDDVVMLFAHVNVSDCQIFSMQKFLLIAFSRLF